MINLATIIYLFTLPLLLVDAYNSDSTLSTYLHISSRHLALIAIFILCLLRICYKQSPTGILSKFNKFVLFPVSLGLGVLLTIYDYLTPPNYVFSLFHLQYTQLCLIALFSGIVILLQQSDQWFNRYYPQAIFISTPIILFSAFITSLFPFDIFKILSQEDHLIENIQVVVLLLAALWAFLFSRSLFKKKIKTHAFIFGLTALTLIMVAGDEISWGQRIFNFQTPKQVAPYNTQRETTIHNLSFFEKSVSTGYILLGLYGTVSWIIQSRFKNLKKQPFYFYIPPMV